MCEPCIITTKLILLSLSEIDENKYRYYNEFSLKKLQQIMFYRELGFSLKEIAPLLEESKDNQTEDLKKQKHLLLLKRKRLDNLILLLEANLKGERMMSLKEFDLTEIEKNRQKYSKEVKERWGGSKAYKESKEKAQSYNKKDWQEIDQEGKDILKEFASLVDAESAKSPKAQLLVQKWQNFISAKFYKCPKEILGSLGLIYVSDERFKNYLDQYGKRTA